MQNRYTSTLAKAYVTSNLDYDTWYGNDTLYYNMIIIRLEYGGACTATHILSLGQDYIAYIVYTRNNFQNIGESYVKLQYSAGGVFKFLTQSNSIRKPDGIYVYGIN